MGCPQTLEMRMPYLERLHYRNTISILSSEPWTRKGGGGTRNNTLPKEKLMQFTYKISRLNMNHIHFFWAGLGRETWAKDDESNCWFNKRLKLVILGALIKGVGSSCFPFPSRCLELFLQRVWNTFHSKGAWVTNQLPFIVTCFKYLVHGGFFLCFSPPLLHLWNLLPLSLLPSSACFTTFLFRQLEGVIAKMTKENASVL